MTLATSPSGLLTITIWRYLRFQLSTNIMLSLDHLRNAASGSLVQDLDTVASEGTDRKSFISPAFDVSVQGFDDDEQPESSGADLMTVVVRVLQEAAIKCCFASEAALIYYGAHRMMLVSVSCHQNYNRALKLIRDQDWILCVEDDEIATASALIRSQDHILQPFRRSAMKPSGTIDHHFPRFKFTGYRCFFHVVPALVHRISCESDAIEFSRKGLPFPKLAVYAQSLLETMNLVDLDDLVDGMNLSYAWGVENLDLEGVTDTAWAAQRHLFHDERGEWPPIFLRKVARPKLEIWRQVASEDSKNRRRGHKALPRDETRFRLKGQRDPRELHMW
nr:hypothetical protein CFP56_57828 [Quercus suber]